MRTLLALTCIVVWLSGCAPVGDPGQLQGSKAPAATFEAVASGEPAAKLGEMGGQVILIDFWATWCGPCHQIMPELQKLHEKYGPQGLRVLGVSDEDRSTVEAFAQSRAETYPLYLDMENASGRFGVSGIPTLVLIGKNGKVIYTHVGAPLGEEVESQIVKALEA